MKKRENLGRQTSWVICQTNRSSDKTIGMKLRDIIVCNDRESWRGNPYRERIHRRMNLIKTHRQRQGMQWRRRLKETGEGLEDNETKRGYEGKMYRPNDLCMNVVSKEEKSLSIFAFIPIEQKEEYEWMNNDKRAESLVPSSLVQEVLFSVFAVSLPPSVQLSLSIWS